MTKSATKEGTRRYAQRFAARAASGHFREAQRMLLSSLGLGTYLGQPDKMTDEAYTAAVVAAAESGINLFDSAINYRFQRSERSIGAALEQLAAKGFSRRSEERRVGKECRSVWWAGHRKMMETLTV